METPEPLIMKKNVKYGYAAAPEPDSLQAQVEILENAAIPVDKQYAEIDNPAHGHRNRFKALMNLAQAGDTIAVVNLSALGANLMDTDENVNAIKEKGLVLEVLDLSDWDSQEAMIYGLHYFNNLYHTQEDLNPAAGKPRKPYPLGWRNAYKKYMNGEISAAQICDDLGITTYDFYRMSQRYRSALRNHREIEEK